MAAPQEEGKYSEGTSIALESKKMDLDSGWLGKIFGSARNAPLNIAGLVLFALVGSGVLLLFVQGQLPASDYWRLITPAVTLILGYVFGRRAD